MGKTLHALLWSALFGFATTATATVINFSFTGVPNCAPHSCTDELTGSFTFADGLLSVDLTDLSAFSLTDTFTYTDVPIAFTVTRSLADLQSFAATLDAAQNVLSLTFKTNNFNDQVGGVVFTSTAAPNVEVVHCFDAETKDGPQERCGALSTGSFIATTAVSEPSIMPLLVIGLGMAGFGYLGIGYEYLKRRRAHNLT
jgi:hypothetical protein